MEKEHEGWGTNRAAAVHFLLDSLSQVVVKSPKENISQGLIAAAFSEFTPCCVVSELPGFIPCVKQEDSKWSSHPWLVQEQTWFRGNNEIPSICNCKVWIHEHHVKHAFKAGCSCFLGCLSFCSRNEILPCSWVTWFKAGIHVMIDVAAVGQVDTRRLQIYGRIVAECSCFILDRGIYFLQ